MIRRFVGILKLRLSSINLKGMMSVFLQTRKIRANHLGSNLRPGAEAQFVNHAVQMSRQRLVLQFQSPHPQLRPFHPLLQRINISPLPIDTSKELVLLFIDVRVPGTIAVGHSFCICLNLGQVLLHLGLLPLQTIPLEVNHGSARLLE